MKSINFVFLFLVNALLLNAQIGFLEHETINDSLAIDNPESVNAVDLDGDGDLDIVSISLLDNKIAWYENLDGLGNFGPQQIITTSSIMQPRFVISKDIDNDGDIDIVASTFVEDRIVWFENIDGAGNFSDEILVVEEIAQISCFYVCDIDGDDDLDIVLGRYGTLRWVENINGQGDFGPSQIIESDAEGIRAIFCEDIDGDGDNDIVTSSIDDEKIIWYENMNGLGEFGNQYEINDETEKAYSIFVSDVNGDGFVDILFASLFGTYIAWHENMDGSGEFSEKIIISEDVHIPQGIITSDLDSDGDMDVISISASGLSGDKTAWYENVDGLGSFGVQQIITTNTDDVNSIIANDINNDNNIDIVLTSEDDNKIKWFENISLITNKIQGIVRLDVNNDGCSENFDLPISNLMIVSNDGNENIATISLPNGVYQLFPDLGTFSTTITSSIPNYYQSNPIDYSHEFTNTGNTEVANFCLNPVQSINDLSIAIYPITDTRPGFNASYRISYSNIGTVQQNGQITLEYNNSKLFFLSSSEPVSSQTINAISFDYNNLNPFESRSIDIDFNVLPPPDTNIDEVLFFTAAINLIGTDINDVDNSFLLEQTVVGSFDPNDITVLEGDNILIDEIGNYLHYLIRFQNTGTAEAINVVVENELDDNLDWSTLKLESYSHSNSVQIIEDNKVQFIFNNIYLPDSLSNEPESHGFISYKIKPKQNIDIGTIIYNSAQIYFDFNEAIETNLVYTEVVDPLSTNELFNSFFSLYPIPTKNSFSITSDLDFIKVEIYNNLGQLLLTNNLSDRIDISQLIPGIYYCKVTGNDGRKGIKKIILK